MGRKRQDMRPGEFDQVTDECPKSRRRLAPFATPDIAAWLTMQAVRHQKAQTAMLAASASGVSGAAGKAAVFHTNALTVIGQLVATLNDKFDDRDWWDAVHMLRPELTRDGVVFAVGPDGIVNPQPAGG